MITILEPATLPVGHIMKLPFLSCGLKWVRQQINGATLQIIHAYIQYGGAS